MLFKKSILRGFLGIPIGVFISTTISIIYSLAFGEIMAIPYGMESSNSLTVYIAQYFVSIIIGFVFSASSVIFEIDEWSLLKQTVVHFFITTLVFFPCSIKVGWIDVNPMSILIYIGVFIFIYLLVWISIYFTWKSKIKKLNNKLEERQ
ncbi:DUF3021 domain-containing protein [Clostridium oceanicum]|uniref:DUF3021 domain-containing protein n=1 Tax=Clostridium oceanicum TaxID=1543 RepID=A0ABP3UHG7_9CLOT